MAVQDPNFDANRAQQLGQDVHDLVVSFTAGVPVIGLVAESVATIAGTVMMVLVLGILGVLRSIIELGAWFGAFYLDSLDAAKEQQQDAINGLIASSTNELLGTDIDPAALASGNGGGSVMDTNLQIGRAILGQFEDAFGGGGAVTPEQGAANAQKFCGWAVNFATSQGFLSILSEAASIGFLKEFHELPDAVRGALGIGRLQRIALQPLLENAVQKPYREYTNALFRPQKLTEAQLIRAHRNGTLDRAAVGQQLARLGYSDDLIDFLISDFSQHVGTAELLTLANNGDISDQDIITALQNVGWAENDAKLLVKALQEGEAKSEWDGLLSELENSYVNGFIDQETYNSVLDKLPLGGEKLDAFRAKVGFRQDVPRKRVSFADVKNGIIHAVVDFSYLDEWMIKEGYGPEDQKLLSFQVLEAITSADRKRAYAKYKADQLRVKGKPIPPWITDAESLT